MSVVPGVVPPPPGWSAPAPDGAPPAIVFRTTYTTGDQRGHLVRHFDKVLGMSVDSHWERPRLRYGASHPTATLFALPDEKAGEKKFTISEGGKNIPCIVFNLYWCARSDIAPTWEYAPDTSEGFAPYRYLVYPSVPRDAHMGDVLSGAADPFAAWTLCSRGVYIRSATDVFYNSFRDSSDGYTAVLATALGFIHGFGDAELTINVCAAVEAFMHVPEVQRPTLKSWQAAVPVSDVSTIVLFVDMLGNSDLVEADTAIELFTLGAEMRSWGSHEE